MAATVDIVLNGVDNASGAINSVGSALGSLGGIAANVAGFALAGVATAFAGVTAAAGAFIAKTVASNAEFERYNAQFTVLLGSAGAAEERLKELAKFGATTPFELPEVVRADKILQGFGLHAVDAKDKFGFAGTEIRRIAGDEASGAGVSFEEMATYLGKFSAGATGEAISRFQELGIITRQEMADLGLEFSKSGQLLSPLPEAMEVLLTAMNKKYGGLMDVQSATFEGMMSNLTDWVDGTIREAGKPIFDALKEQLGSLLTFLNSDDVKQFAADTSKYLASLAGAFAAFISGISQGDLGLAFDDMNSWLNGALDVFSPFISGIIGIKDAFALLVGGGASPEMFSVMLLKIADEYIPGVREALQPLILGIINLGEAFIASLPQIESIAAQVFANLSAMFSAMAPQLVENMTATVTALTDLWTQWGPTITAVVAAAFEILVATISGALLLLSGLFTSFLQLLNGDWSGAWQTLLDTGAAFMNAILAMVGTDLETFLSVWKTNWDMAVTIVGAVWAQLMGKVGEFQAVGSAIIDGIAAGVNIAAGNLAAAAIGAANSALAGVKTALGIHSPSTAFAEVGQNMMAGMAQGVDAGAGMVSRSATSAAMSSVSNVTNNYNLSIQTTTPVSIPHEFANARALAGAY